MSDSRAVFRTPPSFLPCPPPRTANLEWASWVNLRSIVDRVLADAEACVRLWERMEYVESQRWMQGRRETLDEKIARVVYLRQMLEGGGLRVGNQDNAHENILWIAGRTVAGLGRRCDVDEKSEV